MDECSCLPHSGDRTTRSALACNICLRRIPESPVAGICGHVFCWPCLYRSWPQQSPGVEAGPANTKSCPECGIALREGYNIVAIYGFDSVASPTSGTERPTTTGTTTAAAAAAPDTTTITSSRPTALAAAPVSNTPIPPRPTEASYFTSIHRRPHSVTFRAATAAAPNTAIRPRPAAASSDTDIPPRPNSPARTTQTQAQPQQTDTVPALPLARRLSHRRRFPLHNAAGQPFCPDTGVRVRRASSATRHRDLEFRFRSTVRQRNVLLEALRLNRRGMDGNGGSRSVSRIARMERLSEILNIIAATLAEVAEISAHIDAHIDEPEDDLI